MPRAGFMPKATRCFYEYEIVSASADRKNVQQNRISAELLHVLCFHIKLYRKVQWEKNNNPDFSLLGCKNGAAHGAVISYCLKKCKWEFCTKIQRLLLPGNQLSCSCISSSFSSASVIISVRTDSAESIADSARSMISGSSRSVFRWTSSSS